MDFKCAIFDLDGTILDSMTTLKNIATDYFINNKLFMPIDYFEKIKNFSIIESAIYTKKICNTQKSYEDIVKEWKAMAFYEYKRKIVLKKGVYEYLIYLKENSIKICGVIKNDEELYNMTLKRNKIHEFFDMLINQEEFEPNHLRTSVYSNFLEKFNLKEEDCAIFTAFLNTMQETKSLGMKVYGVYDNYKEQPLNSMFELCNEYITDFRELIL